MANSEIISRKDPLTGFHTKEGLYEYLTSRLSSVYEKPQSLSVIILDLDKFKTINDTYGHLVGDDALRFFAMAINLALKGQHFVARYGGDEFVVIMSDKPDGSESLEIARRMKKILSKEMFNTTKGYIKIGSSIGIANYPNDAKTVHELMEAADKALYYVKKHGRNRAISSRHLRVYSLWDSLSFTFRFVAVILALILVFLGYRGADIVSKPSRYLKNLNYYLKYQVYQLTKMKKVEEFTLSDGRMLSGWIVSESVDFVLICLVEPKLNINPFSESSELTIQPVAIPRNLLKSSF